MIMQSNKKQIQYPKDIKNQRNNYLVIKIGIDYEYIWGKSCISGEEAISGEKQFNRLTI